MEWPSQISLDRIVHLAGKMVAVDYTPALQNFLLGSGYPLELVEQTHLSYDEAKGRLWVDGPEELKIYEFGDGDEQPPVGAIRNFFAQKDAIMTAALDDLADRMLNNAFL